MEKELKEIRELAENNSKLIQKNTASETRWKNEKIWRNAGYVP